ncbi:MAG TPA: F0F1 ATP synthase subunit A [Candidatus Borkfalkia excrementigallinarum]|uniref:F0F1 ATP synthase subunit A n=1 Tax=Candidatus Borkfalkia excrementigallinarum TaxID=2838506 RepID=A0A9D1ZWB9_9FIRM|nr:F0F1 ATP synthase subunit A [Candidatus Borkfalkia excrementigallinarum]
MNLSAQLLAVDFSELGDKIFPNTQEHVIEWGWFIVNDSVFSGFVVVVALLLVALIFRLTVIRKWKTTPTAMQMFLEWLVSFFDKSADEMTEEYSGLMGPYTLGAAAYICCGVLIEMFGLRPAMADLGACLALALCTFLFIHTLGFAKNKARRLLHYVNPINIITDLAVPVSMTFRLFGSILSGMVMMDLVYILVEGIWYIGLPLILPAILTPLFTLFHAFIQSYVFASLTLTFVQEAIEVPPKKEKKKKRKKAVQADAVSI